ncbi:hypothetical protein Acor_08860 [Acrocarpospora corrugata]|uniref:Uncharacterized protein n=1 Tax=Acrocarpospora corrugata TaxID=35763 RepID=A0A5M3VUR4_9ACTN|nr:hypothetical protein Acor_08860 [Acrocarpospora corrugata]
MELSHNPCFAWVWRLSSDLSVAPPWTESRVSAHVISEQMASAADVFATAIKAA